MSSTERLGLHLVLYVRTVRRLVGELGREAQIPLLVSLQTRRDLGGSSAKVERGSDLLTAAVGLWSNWDSVSEKDTLEKTLNDSEEETCSVL